MSEEKLYWVGLSQVKGLGAVHFRRLLSTFGNARSVWEANKADLCAAGLSPKLYASLEQVRAHTDLGRLMEELNQAGIEVLTWEDPTYPSRLKQIEQPPPVLYVRGKLDPLDDFAVAIVGTRRATSYGRQVAEQLGEYLAQNGVTVVSGLARGIDAAAHQAALRGGGRTLAVLGNGVDQVYPPEHRHLAERLMLSGALLSDYPPGTKPEGTNFPPRNRIISGLSMAVVIVEAGNQSGALITASFAAEQGREVFAVPGNIFSPESKGTNHLILEGARPLLEYRDVLEALEIDQIQAFRQNRAAFPTDETEQKLIQALGSETLHVNELCVLTGLPIQKVSSELALMELKGLVKQVGGMRYAAAR